MNPTRIGIAASLIFLIIVLGVIISVNKDTLFTNYANLTYADGCIEEYINGVLVTDECQYKKDTYKDHNNIFRENNKYDNNS